MAVVISMCKRFKKILSESQEGAVQPDRPEPYTLRHAAFRTVTLRFNKPNTSSSWKRQFSWKKSFQLCRYTDPACQSNSIDRPIRLHYSWQLLLCVINYGQAFQGHVFL